MDEKLHQATPQRPEGERPLDAALIPIDLIRYTAQIRAEEAYSKNGKNAITLFKSECVTITLIALQEGKDFHPIKHEAEMIMSLQVLEGTLDFENLGKSQLMQAGELITLHQSLAFCARAKSASICLLTLFKS